MTPNKTDAGNGSKTICRVSNVLRSPSPDPRRSADFSNTMQPSVAYHGFRILWFIGGPVISYLMCLGVAIGAGLTGPYGGFTKHEQLSMNSLMLFSAIAAVLGILALIGTRYGWIRVSGRLMLFVVAPILLGIHFYYSWASAGPVHRLDASLVAGLVLSWAAAIALWDFTCWLGRRHTTKTAEHAGGGNSAALRASP